MLFWHFFFISSFIKIIMILCLLNFVEMFCPLKYFGHNKRIILYRIILDYLVSIIIFKKTFTVPIIYLLLFYSMNCFIKSFTTSNI
nr:MAG TPA: hypothetical protein [Caudoviricetes sp.]